jgi:cytidylate kinase
MAPGEWEKYQKLVLAELERLNEEFKSIDEKVDNLAIDLATLKTKSKMWGAVAGFVVSFITAVTLMFLKGIL